MKTKAIFVPVLVLDVLLLSENACKDENKYKKEIAQLDSLSAALKNVNEQILHADTLVIQEKVKQVKKDLSQIDTLLPDTIKDKELAILLMEHRSALNPLIQYPARMKTVQGQLSETQKRIEDLRNDLAKDIADDKQVAQYISDEKMNTGNIMQSFSLINSVRDSILKKTGPESELIRGRITELEILKKNKKKKK